jgi:hypothetical protein
MEDLDKCEERHTSLVCAQDLRFIKTLYFPTYLMDKQVGKLPETENLPKIQRLLISSCDECTHGRVLQGDVTGFAINHPSESKRQLYHRMDPIVASLGYYIKYHWHAHIIDKLLNVAATYLLFGRTLLKFSYSKFTELKELHMKSLCSKQSRLLTLSHIGICYATTPSISSQF